MTGETVVHQVQVLRIFNPDTNKKCRPVADILENFLQYFWTVKLRYMVDGFMAQGYILPAINLHPPPKNFWL
jgi:hypothetical protein